MPKRSEDFPKVEMQGLFLRFPVGLRQQIIEDIEIIGDHGSLSSWLRSASIEYLDSRKELRERLGGGGPRQ